MRTEADGSGAAAHVEGLLARSLDGQDLACGLEKLDKTGICKRSRRQLVGQQRNINLGHFLGAVVALNGIDGQQADHQGNQWHNRANAGPPTQPVIGTPCESSATASIESS